MSYFVRIDEPVALRKTILTAAKEAILYQYKYQEYAKIRQKKLELLAQIDATFEDLEESTDALLDDLDVEELEEDLDTAVAQKEQVSEGEQAEDEEESSEALSDADRLKYTLDRIESTLDNL